MLREFQLRDQGELRSLVLAGLRERWGEEFDPTCNPDLDDIQQYYVERGAFVAVVQDRGAIVGTGTLVDEGGGVGRIVRMSVASAHRRRGIAREIVAALIAAARAQLMTEVRVLTDTPWTSAVALYRSCGFEDLGDDGVDTHFRMGL